MICKKCGVVLEENDAFCPGCGASVQEMKAAADAPAATPVEVPAAPAAPEAPAAPAAAEKAKAAAAAAFASVASAAKSDKAKETKAAFVQKLKSGNPVAVVGFVAGLALAVYGLTALFGADTRLSYTSFGGDYQTYTYKALYYLEKTVVQLTRVAGGILTALGGLLSNYSYNHLSNEKKD